MLRGPLVSAFALGWGASMMISSTLVPRLLIDGAVSFLFVPLLQLLAFRIVYRPAGRTPFTSAADAFFATNTPWLAWIFALGLWCMAQTPREAALWSWTEVVVALSAMVPAVVRSWWLERDLLQMRESLLYRALAWPAIATYFLGFAVWADLRWMFA
jgi:hypothetical protein